jgi:hypothetical protein
LGIFTADMQVLTDEIIKEKRLFSIPILGMIYFFLGLLIFITYRENLDDKIEKELALKIHKQNETALMMDNLQESILIKSDNKIDSLN